MKTEINTSQYVRSHGKQPKGTGCWAFGIRDKVVFAPTLMSLTDAIKWARGQAKAVDAKLIEVLP